MLGCIYDELMQPYPKELESVLSPDQSTGDSSVFNQSLQSCGGDTSISQPVSVVSDVLLNRPERNSRYVDLDRGCCGRDRMVVGFTTYAISAYHH